MTTSRKILFFPPADILVRMELGRRETWHIFTERPQGDRLAARAD
jgi:hypothetical protein